MHDFHNITWNNVFPLDHILNNSYVIYKFRYFLEIETKKIF